MTDYRIRIGNKELFVRLRKFLRREIGIKGDLWITERTIFHPYIVQVENNEHNITIPKTIHWNGYEVQIVIKK